MAIRDVDPATLPRYWSAPGEPPRVCVWEITLACDQACRHCGSRAGAARDGELTTQQALATVAELAALGIRELILIGGEAYLRDDWPDIAAAAVAAGMACSMVTGGHGLDAFHLEQARAAGVSLIGVSIDGIGATHDRLRGRVGSFERATAAARRIAASGSIGLSINSQVNRLSLPELPRLAALVAELGATGWQLQLTVALGRAADRPDLLLQPYHLLSLMPLLLRLKEEVLEPAGVTLFPGNNIGYFGPFEQALRFGADRGHSWSGCMAGRAAIGLEADGTVKGCPSLPTEAYRCGSVKEQPLAEIWQNSDAMHALGRRSRADLWGFCGTCEHGDRCLAGCTWTAHALFGRPGNNPYCHHRALSLAAAGRRERVELVAAAPGRPFDHGRYRLIEEPIGAAADATELALMLGQLFGDTGSRWSRDGLERATAKRAPMATGVEVVP